MTPHRLSSSREQFTLFMEDIDGIPNNSLCTIREALLVEQQKLLKSTNGDDNCLGIVGRGGVDVVGIVLNISFQIFHDRVLTFLMTDSSLPNGCFVKLILRGDNTNAILSKVMNGSIQRGDVVRWNGLALRRNNYNSSNTNDSLLGEFHICHPPTSTISCFKLGSLLQLPPKLPTIQQQQQKETAYKDYESPVFDLVEDKFIPSEMITPTTLVRDLLFWYYTRLYETIEPSGNNNRLSIDTIGPCRRRKLNEITLPNLMSDIVVQIHSFYNNHINSTSNTRRKWGQHPTLVAFAVVCDGEQEEDFAIVQILTISNHYQHLSSELQRCTDQGNNRQGCWVLLRQVLSQSNNYIDDLRQRQHYYYRCHQRLLLQCNPNNDTGNIILVTTCGTTVSILPENPYKKKKNQALQNLPPNRADLIYDDPSSIHSPSSLPSQNHLLVPQLHQKTSDMKSLSCNNFSPNQPFYANLHNIYFSDLDFYLFRTDAGTKSYYDQMQSKTYINKLPITAGRDKLISMISAPPLKTNRPKMRSATLILGCSERLVPNKICPLYQQSHNGMISVIANEEIMELLCGGVPLKDIESFIYYDCGTLHDDTSSSQLLMLVASMLVALVEEKISLLWSVEQRDDNSWYVTDVRLPAL